MTPDEELNLLDSELKRFMKENPNTFGTLRITNTCLRACTKSRWENHGWSPTDTEISGILNGNDDERKAALLSLLKAHYVHNIEIVPGVDVLEMVVIPSLRDHV